MLMEIKVLSWDRHNIVTALNWLCLVLFYCFLLLFFYHLSNFLYQLFTDFNDPPKVEKAREASVGPLFVEVVEVKPFDTRDYRPFAVTVSLAIHDVHGHLIKVCENFIMH
jgi:hypothetical protein